MLKKVICVFLAVLMLLSLIGCSGEKKNDKYKIICSVFPIYDWVKSCTSGIENLEVSFIVDSGTDTHSYNATTGDIAAISDADMLIYVGGESDEWIAKVLANLKDKGPKDIKLLDSVCALDHDHGDDHEHTAYDEHIWLSLKNASSLVQTIADAISAELPEASEIISKNSKEYISKITELDKRLEAKIASAPIKTLLFADRFPFGYLTEDYSLEYHAAFSGCSADSEASFETIAGLAKKLDELALPYVLVLESSDKRLAETVIASTVSKSASILVIDSMQSITEKDVSGGATYLSIMESNAKVIAKALGVE